MASSQNRSLNQTASKSQTPSKQLIASMSSLHVKQTIGMGLAAQQNSPNFVTGAATGTGSSTTAPASALDFRNDSSLQQQPTSGTLKKNTILSHSSVNLRSNMFQKQSTVAGGYQPSYLRESQKNYSYVSQSPSKHKSRNSLATTLVKQQGKNQHNFTAQKQRAGDKSSNSALKPSESKNTLSRTEKEQARDLKNRSGSQYIVASKLQSSNSTVRGQNAANRMRGPAATRGEDQQEYSRLSGNQSANRLPMENSFTRLHQGNSSVVRTFERKLAHQASTSLVRNQQQSDQQSRLQGTKNKNSNNTTVAMGNRQGPNQLFNTRDRGSANNQLSITTHYQSNVGGDGPVQLDSQRTTSANCDTSRNGNNKGNISRNKSHKQPRQSKSTINGQGQSTSTVGAQPAQSTARNRDSSSNNAASAATTVANAAALPQAQTIATTLTMTASQSTPAGLYDRGAANQLPESSQTAMLSSNQNASGLETSLSFTRRLIEETAAKKAKEDSKNIEKDISQVSFSIQPHPSIETQAQKFISPKNKPMISTAFGSSIVPKPLISPMNVRGPTISTEKKTPYGRGTSNSANKASHHTFVKPSYGGHTAGSSTVFSPDKRPNLSRGQINNNLYYKRGAKNTTTADVKPELGGGGKGSHQRMFAPQNFSAAAGVTTPGPSASPNKGGGMGGPGYLKSTFTRSTKTKIADKGNVYSYQIGRVRPSKQQQHQTVASHPPPGAPSNISSSSYKDLSAVKVLDQASPRSTNMSASVKSISQVPPSGLSRQTTNSKQGSAATKKKLSTPSWNSSTTFYPHKKGTPNADQRTPKQQTLTRAQRPSSKRGLTEHSVGALQPIQAYQKVQQKAIVISAIQQQQNQAENPKTPLSGTPDIAYESAKKSLEVDQIYTATAATAAGPAESLKPQLSQQIQKSKANMIEASIVTALLSQKSTPSSEYLPPDSYKKKQDQIIEMIQSNMKRSEDIQQSLSSSRFFTSNNNQKSRQSSTSRTSQQAVQDQQQLEGVQDAAWSEQLQHREYNQGGNSETNSKSITASPKISKEPLTLTEQNSRQMLVTTTTTTKQLISKAQIPHVQMKQASPGKGEERYMSISPVGQEESLNVEDVFNDQQLVNNRMAQEASFNSKNNIIEDVYDNENESMSPAQQPSDNTSEEIIANIDNNSHSDSFGPASPLELPTNQNNLPDYKKPQSQFAKALAMKKTTSEGRGDNAASADYDFVDENAPTPKKHTVGEHENPFQISAVEYTEDRFSNDDNSPMKAIDLEIVAEDARESLASNIQRESMLRGEPAPATLPMSKEAFVKTYSSVLTGQEKQELADLEIANNTVYYASDVPTRVDVASAVTNSDDQDGYYVIKAKDQILYRFEILKVLGKGSFAQVVSAIDHMTGHRVAVKINRNTEIDHKFAKQEATLLKFLMIEDPTDDNNIVRLIEHITFREHQCFIFELLNTDLFEHLKDNEFMGFPESQIKSYAAQLLKALVFLEKRNVIHCDLKPENILCVDPARKKLKVVDFGSGCLTHEQVYTYVQSRYYRAPEVILRIPYSEKVDVWSLGCILAELFTGEPLFPGNNEQEQLEFIMELCGMFPEGMIDKSRKKDHYFDTDYSPFLIEDPKHGIMRIPENRTIGEAVPSQDDLFLDFIKQCLVLNPDERPGAAEAATHPWLKDCFDHDGFIGKQDSTIANEQQQYSKPIQGYTPLRSHHNSNNASFAAQSNAEQLDLEGNMLMGAGDDHKFAEDVQVEEYYEGKVTESGRASTELYDRDNVIDTSDREAVIKFSHSSMSRQREEAGARETPAEISPDRPLGSFLTEKQRMTSFTGMMPPPEMLGRKSDAVTHPPQIKNLQFASPNKLAKSPLKPSNESLLEHYKYEKLHKTGSNDKKNSIHELYNRSELMLQNASSNQSSATKKANYQSLVEEPKIMSVSATSFGQQSKQ